MKKARFSGLLLGACALGLASESVMASPPERPNGGEVLAPASVPRGPSPPASKGPRAQLRGLGATRPEWDSSHQPATGYAPGVAYGPMFRLPSGETSVTYAGVAWAEDGRVVYYTVYLPRPLTLEAATARAMAELPADAVRLDEKRATGCSAIRFSSPMFRGLFGKEPHGGVVIVTFSGPNPERFTPRTVTSFDVSFDLSPGSDPC
jgi:hypothetical protein